MINRICFFTKILKYVCCICKWILVIQQSITIIVSLPLEVLFLNTHISESLPSSFACIGILIEDFWIFEDYYDSKKH